MHFRLRRIRATFYYYTIGLSALSGIRTHVDRVKTCSPWLLEDESKGKSRESNSIISDHNRAHYYYVTFTKRWLKDSNLPTFEGHGLANRSNHLSSKPPAVVARIEHACFLRLRVQAGRATIAQYNQAELAGIELASPP